MTHFLSPSSSTNVNLRRGSFQPSTRNHDDEENLALIRRQSCPADDMNASKSPMARLKRDVNLVQIANSIFKKSGRLSDDSDYDDKEFRRSYSEGGSGSTNSLKSVSPHMSRADIEKCDFIIPTSNNLTNYVPQYKEPLNLGSLDITQYLSQEEAQELKEIGAPVKLGETKFCLAYSDIDQKLKFILKSIEISLKPSPSVVGSNWLCDTVATLELLQDKKKTQEVKFGHETLIDIKKSELHDKTLRLTIYDTRRRHPNLAIGHVILPIRDLTELTTRFTVHSKKIVFYSQPAGFNKGKLSVSLTWISSLEKIEIKVGEASSLKNPYHEAGKEYFLKLTAYLVGVKYKSFKTSITKANPKLPFGERFMMSMTSSQIKDSSFVLHLYLKHTSKKMMTSKILVGKTVIGPYMKHVDGNFSQWEKVINSPMEEIHCNHVLYL